MHAVAPPERSKLAVWAAALAVLPPALAAFCMLVLGDGFGHVDARTSIFLRMMLATVPASLVLGIVAFIRSLSARRSGTALAMLAVLVSGGVVGGFMWMLSGLAGMHGRVLRVRGRQVLVRVRRPAGAAAELPDLAAPLAALDRRDRAAVVDHWTLVAREEHTSVEAFARLARALAAHGAPASLIAGAHAAARQEADHAARCFAVASACAGRALAPAPTDPPDAPTPTLAALAVEALIDGGLGEGTGAAEAATLAADPTLPATLRADFAVIARDEAAHAELSWSVLAWCLAVGGPQLHAVVARALAALADADPPGEGVARTPAQRALGLATPRERADAWHTTLSAARARLADLLRAAPRAA